MEEIDNVSGTEYTSTQSPPGRDKSVDAGMDPTAVKDEEDEEEEDEEEEEEEDEDGEGDQDEEEDEEEEEECEAKSLAQVRFRACARSPITLFYF
jgi:hypothetical protein